MSESNPALINPDALASFRDLASDDDPHFVRTYLSTVLAAIEPRLVTLAKAIETRDAAKLESEAHALKSSCANSEIGLMTALCSQLESQGKAGSFDGATKRLESLAALFEQLKAEIHALPEFAD